MGKGNWNQRSKHGMGTCNWWEGEGNLGEGYSAMFHAMPTGKRLDSQDIPCKNAVSGVISRLFSTHDFVTPAQMKQKATHTFLALTPAQRIRTCRYTECLVVGPKSIS